MKKQLVSYTLLLISVILIFCSSNIKWGREHWKGVLDSDAQAYYAYLPAFFIYQDPGFRFIESVEKKLGKEINTNEFDFRQPTKYGAINKYYCGTALAQLPFFVTAHLLSGWFGFDQDGYSKLYMILVCIAGITYALTGLIFLLKLLQPFKLNEWQKALVLLTMVFGTNLFVYSVLEPGMSHIYSFAFVTAFLYYSQRYFSTLQNRYFLLMAMLLGLITLVRPVNILVVFLLPFIANSYYNFQNGLLNLLRRPFLFIYGFLIFIAILSLQLIIYKITIGHFFVYSYGNEKFNFSDPHIIDFLFSYRKGMFLYTPVFFVSMAGAYYLYKQNRFSFLALFGFLSVLIYVLSSWWSWSYGGSFSARPMLEFSAIFAILLSLTLANIKPGPKYKFFVSIIIFLVLVCQFQTYQYRKGEILWDNMTKERYWQVFLNPDILTR